MVNKFKIYDFLNQELTASTILGEFEGQRITVSQMLTAIDNCIRCIEYIKENFTVNQNTYSIALFAMKMLKRRLNNLKKDKLTVEQLKSTIDVFHEIADMQAKSDADKQKNEEIAFDLKMLIDFLDKYQKEQPK